MPTLPKRALITIGIAIAATSIALLLPSPQDRPPRDDKPVVAVTSHPLFDIAASVAGDEATVISILPPGANPHTFDPTPASIRVLARARAIYAVGHGFDDWIDPLLRETAVTKVVVDAGVALRETAESFEDAETHDEEGEEHGPIDPHYWLDARNAVLIARTIARDLSARLPSSASRIEANLAATVARIEKADREAREIIASAPVRRIVTMHDAWYYFAEAYGLEIVGSFEPSAGREPSPRYLAELERAIRAAGAKAIYVEPTESSAAIRGFAADNGLEIVALDPMEGNSLDPYDVILIRNAQAIADHQR